MRATITALLCPDIDNLETYIPEDPTLWGFPLQMLVGEDGMDGGETFSFTVCTLEWAKAQMVKDGFLLGHHYIFLPEYNYAALIGLLERLCFQSAGANWGIVARRLSKYSDWEFEGDAIKQMEESEG